MHKLRLYVFKNTPTEHGLTFHPAATQAKRLGAEKAVTAENIRLSMC